MRRSNPRLIGKYFSIEFSRLTEDCLAKCARNNIIKIASQRLTCGARNQPEGHARGAETKKPENKIVFGASKQTCPRESASLPSSIQTLTVGPGVSPGHAHLLVILSECEGSARGLYHRSGIAPCPEGSYSIVKNYTIGRPKPSDGWKLLSFYDALYRADRNALG